MRLLDEIETEINSINQDCRLEIRINRNTQLKIARHYKDLLIIDIEPDFNGEKYKGIPIVVDNRLRDGQYVILAKPI